MWSGSRGLGGTLWGANAVNGIINIVTAPADETVGGMAKVGAGNEERGFLNVRYGGEWGTGTYGRVYAKLFARDALVDKAGNPAEDDWRMGCGGFRLDRNLERGRLTWQGGFYQVLHLYQLAGRNPAWVEAALVDVKAAGEEPYEGARRRLASDAA